MHKLRAMLFASITISFCSLHCFAQSQSQITNPGTTVADVPMLFRGAMPAVEVMVNGQGPFLFAIDTGGQGMARVDSSLAEKLKLKAVGTVQASDGSGRNARTMDVVQLDSIAFGGVQFKDVRAGSRDYNTAPGLPHIDGILGFNLFADYLLTLDFPARRVRLGRGELPAPDGAQILRFENPNGVPVVEIAVGSVKINAHVDSGNMAGGFILPGSLVEKLALASAPVTVGTGRTVSSQIEMKAAQLKDNIRWGRYEYTRPTVSFPAVSNNANIGASVLREFALTFDQKNKRLRLEKPVASKEAVRATAEELSALKSYTGRYGARIISLEGAELYLQRIGGPKLRLLLVSKDEFTLEGVPAARLKFTRDEKGGVSELNVLNPSGEWEKSKREQP